MSEIHDLERLQSTNGLDPVAATNELTALLDLHSVGVAVRSARIVGRGSNASADLYLSDGTSVFFERLRDFATPARLMSEIAICTGATPRIKLPQALRATALLRMIATHQASAQVDDISIDWGVTYLQSATVLEVDLNDQAARWRAFCELAKIDSEGLGRSDGPAARVVLRQPDTGTRYIRTGWFRAYVKAEDGTVSPQQIIQRMERIGWSRRGANGRIKATCPGRPGQLAWNFFVVPAGWEEQQ